MSRRWSMRRIIRNDLWEPHYGAEKVADWYIGGLEDGDYRLRIRMVSAGGGSFERINTVRI